MAKVPKTLADEREFINILYYGEAGTGKTTALAHMATLGKVVYVDSEAGLKVGPLKRLGIPLENIQPVRTVTYADLDGLYHQLQAALATDPDAFAGIVLDSISEVQRKILELEAANPLEVTQRDYGKNTQQLRSLIRKFRDLPCHTGFTSHVRRDQDEDDGTVRYGPSLTPAVQGDILGYVDLVAYNRAVPSTKPDDDEPEYLAHFRPVGKYKAKDRFGCLPPILYNPTFDRVNAYVEGVLRREAQAEADTSTDVPDGLDIQQYEYRQRVKAAKEAAGRES